MVGCLFRWIGCLIDVCYSDGGVLAVVVGADCVGVVSVWVGLFGYCWACEGVVLGVVFVGC